MPKYEITNTMYLKVTRTAVVEAADRDEAEENFHELFHPSKLVSDDGFGYITYKDGAEEITEGFYKDMPNEIEIVEVK